MKEKIQCDLEFKIFANCSFFCIILLTIFIVITQVGNDKPESSASDEESSHLTGDKDRTDHKDDGPTYATVKKPKKSLHLSTK